jgi:hypothetical protein
VFAFSFTACHPFGFIAATLAFCGGLWLGAEAQAETGSAVSDTLSAQFGPLTWTDEHRFPTQCDPLPTDDRAFEAADLDGIDPAPSPFMIVEGDVLEIYQGRNRWFINFGPDFRTDFTVSLQDRPLNMVRQRWPEPENWIGQRVRVSGYVDMWNGLFIEWDFPEQLCFTNPVPYKLANATNQNAGQ